MSPIEAAAVLGVPLGVSAVVLRARRIQLVKRLHPDVCTGNVSEFVRVQQAFEVLSGFVDSQVEPNVPVPSSPEVDVEVPGSSPAMPGWENAPASPAPEPAQKRPVYRANLAESAPVGGAAGPVDAASIDAIFSGPAHDSTPHETSWDPDPGDLQQPPEPPPPSTEDSYPDPDPDLVDALTETTGPIPANLPVPVAAAVAFIVTRIWVTPLSPLTVDLSVPVVVVAALVVVALAVIALNATMSRVDLDDIPVPLAVLAAVAGAVLAFTDTLVYAAGPIAAVAALFAAATAPRRS